jgi:hypothetical protein
VNEVGHGQYGRRHAVFPPAGGHGEKPAQAPGGVRFSLGRQTTAEVIEHVQATAVCVNSPLLAEASAIAC